MKLSRRGILQFAAVAPLASRAWGMDLPPTTSRVYPGTDGKLVYVPDEQGNVIHDASHAGYGGGGVAIPMVAIKETIWPVAGDNTAHIQAAIDKVSALPLDANGFRGTVLLRAGEYRMALPVNVRASGVVLRGEGMGDTGTVLIGTGTGRPPADPNAAPGAGGRRAGPPPRPTLIQIAGAAGPKIDEASKRVVTDTFVPVGSRRFRVASGRSFKRGDSVIVRRIGNQAWIDAVGMNNDPPGARWKPFNIEWDRVIVEVSGDTITIDAPITCAIDKQWGGGEVLKYDDAGRIANIGVENMRGVSEFDPGVRTKDYGNMDRDSYAAEEYYSDENHFNNFVTFDNVTNGWVRNATALHFVNSMVGAGPATKWITVQDCVSREPISQRRGARRFVFALRGQLALVQRCQSDKGRHSFMTGQPSGSGNVFLDCKATKPYSSSEPHEQWATGNLYDNIQAPLTARFWKNFIIGWAGANTVFWNCEGNFLIQKPPTAQNYTFGHIGVNAVVFNVPFQDTSRENGYMESLDQHVFPRSLYLTQLRDRLGEAAVRAVATTDQLI
ncbi:hypothetical protein [Sphingobium sp. CR28]|uniref:hypothetical protein n=1 Tax=Sphingobium sp. CR28 TaxID=3400272 RepID=UPI003FEEDC62